MTNARLKAIIRMVKHAGPSKVRDLYYEVYGAEAGNQLSISRCRESIVGACEELLGRSKAPRRLTDSEIRHRHVARRLGHG